MYDTALQKQQETEKKIRLKKKIDIHLLLATQTEGEFTHKTKIAHLHTKPQEP